MAATEGDTLTRLWYAPTILIAILIIAGAGGANLRLLAPGAGFSLFFLGLGLALACALILGAAAAVAAAWGKSWRRHAVRGAVVPMLVMLAVVTTVLRGGTHPIHDVTTDPADGLAFSADVASLRAPEPREAVMEIQRELYPDVQPLRVPYPPDVVFAAALAAAGEMSDWEIRADVSGGGRIEALATSEVFHFEDDIVIRVGPEARGSRVDVRSRSRIGQSDFGVNADRIRTYLEAVRGALEGAADGLE